jgi:uncharacterized membrane protein YdjX (TVP38/TMEM64 family)
MSARDKAAQPKQGDDSAEPGLQAVALRGLAVAVAATAMLAALLACLPPLQVRHLPYMAVRVVCCILRARHMRIHLLTCAASVFPHSQPHEFRAIVSNFPPSSLTAVITLRDTLLSYAQAHPVRQGAACCIPTERVGVNLLHPLCIPPLCFLTVCSLAPPQAWTALGILSLYVTMQAFAIPGTVSLSLLSGALYGTVRGFALVAAVSTVGAVACYGLSSLLGRPLAAALFGRARLDRFRAEIAARRHALLGYIVFLRLTPLLPNVFINVASPIVGVPLADFAAGTIVGCAPNNWLAAHAGARLGELRSLADLYSLRALLLCAAAGGIALLPALLQRGDRRGAAVSVHKLQ